MPGTPDAIFTCPIDERAQGEYEDTVHVMADLAVSRELYTSLARAVIATREMLTVEIYPFYVRQHLADYLSLMVYACEHPTRQRRTRMDVDKMVETWIPLLKKLALAHDIDERDSASSALDDALLPIISAPVDQIRKFYREIVKRLKKDESVPWAVWRLFEFWGENVLDKISKEEVVGLKKELAQRIAEHSIQQIPKEDWVNSMVGALQWRSPEKLEEIETELRSGKKPRVRGKESCLFLEVGEKEVML